MNSGTPQAPMASSYSWQAQPSNGGRKARCPRQASHRSATACALGMAHLLNTGNLHKFKHCGPRSPPTTITT
jgi:hypothetical protein